MSVVFYGADELAPVLLLCCHNRPISDRPRVAALLATVSHANACAWGETHREDCAAVPAAEILAEAWRVPDVPTTRAAALSTISMLRYNCISNAGTNNVADPDVYLALVELLSMAARYASSELA